MIDTLACRKGGRITPWPRNFVYIPIQTWSECVPLKERHVGQFDPKRTLKKKGKEEGEKKDEEEGKEEREAGGGLISKPNIKQWKSHLPSDLTAMKPSCGASGRLYHFPGPQFCHL